MGIVADGSANETPAAASASGSISGTNQKASAVSGDKTVRKVYLGGKFFLTASSITQAMVGTTMYAVDNQTFDDTYETTTYLPLGKLVTYISATSGWVEINPFVNGNNGPTCGVLSARRGAMSSQDGLRIHQRNGGVEHAVRETPLVVVPRQHFHHSAFDDFGLR